MAKSRSLGLVLAVGLWLLCSTSQAAVLELRAALRGIRVFGGASTESKTAESTFHRQRNALEDHLISIINEVPASYDIVMEQPRTASSSARSAYILTGRKIDDMALDQLPTAQALNFLILKCFMKTLAEATGLDLGKSAVLAAMREAKVHMHPYQQNTGLPATRSLLKPPSSAGAAKCAALLHAAAPAVNHCITGSKTGGSVPKASAPTASSASPSAAAVAAAAAAVLNPPLVQGQSPLAASICNTLVSHRSSIPSAAPKQQYNDHQQREVDLRDCTSSTCIPDTKDVRKLPTMAWANGTVSAYSLYDWQVLGSSYDPTAEGISSAGPLKEKPSVKPAGPAGRP